MNKEQVYKALKASAPINIDAFIARTWIDNIPNEFFYPSDINPDSYQYKFLGFYYKTRKLIDDLKKENLIKIYRPSLSINSLDYISEVN